MKKIGLAVCYDTRNFGSQLQVLATVKMVESLGYETEIIRYKKQISFKFLLQTIPRFLNIPFVKAKINAIKKKNKIKKHPSINENVAVRNRRFNEFVSTYFTNLSEPYNGWENLVNETKNNYDMFLCGSDQLWLPHNLGSHFYTLEFAPDNKKKIAYATSFGVKSIPKYQRKRTAKYLNRFQYLSTREIEGSNIIKRLTGKDASVVCDPTLLFGANDWAKIIPVKPVIEQPYIFCYFLGDNEEHRKVAEQLREQTGLKIVCCPFLDNFVEIDREFGDISMFDMDASDFVNLIRHAEFVLTDSFHGSVFSILHHKKFLTFNRFMEGANSRNSRIDSLCELLDLKERRYSGDVSDVKNEVLYDDVEKKLSDLREKSIGYLTTALQ